VILHHNCMFYRTLLAASVLVAAGLPAATSLRGQAVAEIQVTPETMTLGVGQKQMVFAAAYDRQGNLLSTTQFTFWSSDTSIARVLHDGTVVGVRPGLAKVEARAQRRRASLAVLITGPPDDKPPTGAVLTLEPASLLLLPGESTRLVPQALKDDGSNLPLGCVTWKSLKPQVATVDSVGIITGVANGTTIVQITTANGLMATAPIQVASADFAVSPDHLLLAPRQVDTLRARVPAQDNRPVHDGLRWQSLDTTVVRIGPTGGVEARAAGKTELVATGFGQEQRVAVVVHKAPETLVFSPPQRTRLLIPRNGTRRFTAVAEAADSTPIPEVPVAWTLRDTAMAAFDVATGTFTAKAVGTTTLTATVDSFAPVVWTIEVIPGFVRLRGDRIALTPGNHAAVEVGLVDDRGESVGTISELQWVSDRPDIATVDRDGTVHGVAPGRAVITATAPWGQSDTVVALVTGDLLVSSNRGGKFGLYALVRARPDTLFPVLVDSAANVDGVYSPDRTKFAFSSDRAGSYDLYVADADGRDARRVTTDAGEERAPVWTPDGRGLLYTSTSTGPSAAARVGMVDADGRNPHVLMAGDSGSVSPAISDDGRTVAVVAMRAKRPDLYLVAPDNARPPRRITDNAERELLPRFFPNGDLLYAVERGRGKSARVVRRAPAATESTKLFDTDQPLVALSLSRDGTTMAYVVGKILDPTNARAKFTLYLRPTTVDATPVAVPLRLDEQIASVSF
jgi:hypothetical protein